MYAHFKRMMYFISINSGFYAFCGNINYYYISELLQRPPGDFSLFNSIGGIAWSIKPIFGWMSDSYYPFRYRFKIYIILCCIFHILTCVFVIFNKPDFTIFCIASFIININVSFIDTLASGFTAINTKLLAKITKLQETRKRKTGIDFVEDENEIKSFGMFSIIRGLCRAFSNMGGGLLAHMLSI